MSALQVLFIKDMVTVIFTAQDFWNVIQAVTLVKEYNHLKEALLFLN